MEDLRTRESFALVMSEVWGFWKMGTWMFWRTVVNSGLLGEEGMGWKETEEWGVGDGELVMGIAQIPGKRYGLHCNWCRLLRKRDYMTWFSLTATTSSATTLCVRTFIPLLFSWAFPPDRASTITEHPPATTRGKKELLGKQTVASGPAQEQPKNYTVF